MNQMHLNLIGTLDAMTFVQVVLLLQQLLQLQKAKARDIYCTLLSPVRCLWKAVLQYPKISCGYFQAIGSIIIIKQILDDISSIIRWSSLINFLGKNCQLEASIGGRRILLAAVEAVLSLEHKLLDPFWRTPWHDGTGLSVVQTVSADDLVILPPVLSSLL